MNFSKLTQNEKMAAIGAALTIVGGAVAASSYRTWGPAWLGVLAGIAMLVVVFLPQMSAGTNLPGSKGTLMLIAGGVGGLFMAFMLLTTLNFTFTDFDASSVMFLLAVAGALVMAWAGWQAFQAEGGKFNIGSSGGASASAAAPAAAQPPAPPAEAAPPPSAAAASSEPMAPSEPMSPPPPAPAAPSEPMGSTQDDDRA